MQARLLKEADTRIFIIGLGKKVDKTQIEEMSSKPVVDHVFYINDFKTLPTHFNKIGRIVCEKSKYNNNDNNKHSENADTSTSLSCDLDLN